MSVTWEYGLAGFVAGFAGMVAAVGLILLPAELLLRGEPTLTADEFKQAHPRRAWLVDYYLPATALAMLMLFMAPVSYVDRALADAHRGTWWAVTSGVFGFVFFQWIFLPMAGLELATGMTLSLRARGPQGQTLVICSPRVRQAGLFRLALTLAALGAAAGVVEAVRP